LYVKYLRILFSWLFDQRIYEV